MLTLWNKIYFIKKIMKWALKGGFQLMLILGLLDMYFDAAVVFVPKSSVLFRLALAILWAIKDALLSYLPKLGLFEFLEASECMIVQQ
jgi:hypothetical protein